MHRDRSRISDYSSGIIHRAFRQGDLRAQPSAIRSFGNHHLLAGTELDVASGGGDGAMVLNVFSDDEDRASSAGLDGAVIDDIGGGRRRIELPRAAAE